MLWKWSAAFPPEVFREIILQIQRSSDRELSRQNILIGRQDELLIWKDNEIARLETALDLNHRQIEAALAVVGREGISPNRIGETLLDQAQQIKSLQNDLQEASGDSAEIKQKKAVASKALEEGDLDYADTILDEIIVLEDAAIDQDALKAAQTRAQKAQVALSRLRYRDAAEAYAAAAKRVPATHSVQKNEYLKLQANALYDDGNDFGRTESLQQAIKIYQELQIGRAHV